MYVVFGIIELLLILRFVLLFVGANAANTFVTWVYTWSGPFAAPFAGIFGQHSVAAGQGVVVQSVFDWTSLVALIAYAVIGAVLVRLLSHI
jgi:hypothetical protein